MLGPLDRCILNRLPRGNHAELRKAVEKSGVPFIEVQARVKARHLGGILKPELGAIDAFERPDTRTPLYKRRPKFIAIRADWRNQSNSRNRNSSPHPTLALPARSPLHLPAAWRCHPPFHARSESSARRHPEY